VPCSEVQGDLLHHPKPLNMVGIEMSEGEVVDVPDARAVQQARDLRGRVDKEVDVMKKGRGACPGIRSTLLPGFPADTTLAKGFGDYHTAPGAENSHLHQMREGEACASLPGSSFP